MQFNKIFQNFRSLLKEEERWGKVAGGVLVLAQDTGNFLVAKRSSWVMEPNTWNLIGGAISGAPGEEDYEIQETTEIDPQDLKLPIDSSIKKELKEETGYTGPVELKLVAVYRDNDSSFRYYDFLGLVPKEFDAVTNWETERFVWASYEDMLELRPMHFGLKYLLNVAGETIKGIANAINTDLQSSGNQGRTDRGVELKR